MTLADRLYWGDNIWGDTDICLIARMGCMHGRDETAVSVRGEVAQPLRPYVYVVRASRVGPMQLMHEAEGGQWPTS